MLKQHAINRIRNSSILRVNAIRWICDALNINLSIYYIQTKKHTLARRYKLNDTELISKKQVLTYLKECLR